MAVSSWGPDHAPDGAAPSQDIAAWYDVEGRICAHGWIEDGWHVIDVPGVGEFRFGIDGDVQLNRHQAATDQAIERAHRSIVLPLMAQARGHEVLHASAAERDGYVVGFVGRSHAGKSTFAAGLVARANGWRLRGDDALILSFQNGAVSSLFLPSMSDLRPEARAWFHDGIVSPLSSDASALHPLPLRMLFLVQVDQAAATAVMRRLSPSEAFRQLFPHANVFSLRARERNQLMVEHYFSLVQSIPVIALFRPNGFSHLDATLEEVERLARDVTVNVNRVAYP